MRRRKRKQNKIIFISFISLLFLFSVGYCAFSSNFLINGKGTIVEKGIKIGGVSVETVASGSGLYESEYEEGRYIYRGPSPDNYLTLGTDSYRIISKETDGTLKVIKSEKIGDLVFDPGYSTSITGVTSSDSNEGTRYSSNSNDFCYFDSLYYGCKVWGSRTTMLDSEGNNVTTVLSGAVKRYNLPNTESYINTYLNTTWYNSLSSSVQNVITTHLFNVGLVDYQETNIATTLETEKAYKWSGKVGLANASDYVLASNHVNCLSVSDYYTNTNCYKGSNSYNWIYKDIFSTANVPWLINSLDDSYNYSVYGVYSGDGRLFYNLAYTEHSTFPVFYLKSDVKFKGKGTEIDPFVLS